MNFDNDKKYKKKLVEFIQKSGFSISCSGIDQILLNQSKKSYKRAFDSNERKDIDSEKGETVSAVLCAAAACESRVSEYLEHWIFINGFLPDELKSIKNERDALKQWKLLLKFQGANIDFGSNKNYNKLDALFKLRNHIAHRNAKLLKFGEVPAKLEPFVKQKILPVDFSNSLDWIDAFLTKEIAIWAYETANEWLTIVDEFIPFTC